ncbi:MAG: hypothetical protein HUJ51_03410 [Eggerthellaceae bacterium]|nr:hypothetical protein [Eggerthellaceae bacterium]
MKFLIKFQYDAGCMHLIGKDIVICEVHQNSKLTSRVYDCERGDNDRNFGELHLKKQ